MGSYLHESSAGIQIVNLKKLSWSYSFSFGQNRAVLVTCCMHLCQPKKAFERGLRPAATTNCAQGGVRSCTCAVQASKKQDFLFRWFGFMSTCDESKSSYRCGREAYSRRHLQTAPNGVGSYTWPMHSSQKQSTLPRILSVVHRPANVNLTSTFGFWLLWTFYFFFFALLRRVSSQKTHAIENIVERLFTPTTPTNSESMAWGHPHALCTHSGNRAFWCALLPTYLRAENANRIIQWYIGVYTCTHNRPVFPEERGKTFFFFFCCCTRYIFTKLDEP